MLRPSVSRKILRLRSFRLFVRSYHAVQSAGPPDLPPLSDPSFDGVPVRAFPIYQPPLPPAVEEDVDVNSLPSDKYLQKGIKIRLTRKATEDSPELTEEALRNFYRGLIESGREEGVDDFKGIEAPEGRLRLGRAKREEVLGRLERRLLGSTSQAASFASVAAKVPSTLVSVPTHHRLATILSSIAGPSSSAAVPIFSIKGKEKELMKASDVPLGLVSQREWDALFEEFVERRDARGAEAFLDVMARHGMQTDTSYLEGIMNLDAKAGRSEEVARLGARLVSAGLTLDATHHTSFVASLLQTSPPQVKSAMSYLREHEKQGQPLPQPVYHLVLSHLLIPTATYQPTSHTRALAWDLFSHMRLVAHPVPFRDIYSTMIRACGNAGDPQPERARDLWIEMTTEGEKIVPQSEEYDAIVRALSSTKTEYLEAFELLRQMIARHQDAVLVPFEDAPSSAWSRYVPTVATFTALLEGTKRAGDLGRARWIVSEVVRLMRASEAMGEKRLAGPDEEMMAGLFMTYAAWKPMIKREGLKISGSDAKEAEETQEADGLEVDIIANTANTGSPAQYDSQGSSLPSSPRSSADAIREADALFDQTLEATAIHRSQRIHSSSSMRSVHLNPRLVNSYLSVHLAHAPSVGAARDAWLSTWTRVKSVRSSVGPNGWSYLMVLERCSSGSRGGLTTEDRAEAFKWGKQVWEEYSRFAEDSSADAQQEGIIEATSPHRRVNDHAATGRRRRWLAGLGERQVERCWRAIIRLHAIFDDLDTSLRLLDEFHTLHPPSAIVRAYSPLPETDLAIRMTSIGSVPEPDVPPHLIWKDLDVLHQRLVRDEGWKGVGKVKWVTKAYEGALIKRRRYRLKGAGVGRERLREKRLGRMGGRQKVERLGRGDEAGRIGAEKEVEEEGWDDTDELDGGMGGEDMEGLRATS